MSTSISKQIKLIRNQKGFSQELLAERSALSLRTIQRVENSESEPRGDTLIRIAEALNVTPDELLEWNQTENLSTLVVLNLSALCFLFYPILGVIIPLIIWISRKDRIKRVNVIGKKLINFQISFVAFIYLLQASLYLITVFQLEVGVWIESLFDALGIPSYLFLFLIYGIPYAFNFGYILLNTFRIRSGEEIEYRPAFKLIK